MINRKDNRESRVSDQIAEEAGYWDARLRSPDCADADRARFAEWRDASCEHREAFERLQTILAGLRRSVARADVRALRDAALRAEKAPVPGRKLFAVAACVATLVAAIVLWRESPDAFREDPWSESVAMAESLLGSQRPVVYETDTGQRSIRTLRDGSSVELNARTRLKVVFGKSSRNVELIYGQALFHVAHDVSRPFIVRAADREITAVGTQFDVRLDGTSVSVTLIEGKVKVSGELSNRPSYLLPGQQLIAHFPGAHARANNHAARSNASNSTELDTPEANALVRTIDVAKVTGWRDGRIFLEDMTLTAAVAEMNRHSPVQISVADPEIANLRVNGMFRAGEQEVFVTALEKYFPITARDDGDAEIILTRRR